MVKKLLLLLLLTSIAPLCSMENPKKEKGKKPLFAMPSVAASSTSNQSFKYDYLEALKKMPTKWPSDRIEQHVLANQISSFAWAFKRYPQRKAVEDLVTEHIKTLRELEQKELNAKHEVLKNILKWHEKN